MQIRAKSPCIVILLVLVGFSGVQAANITWSGVNADANSVGFWDDPGNWIGGKEPTIDDQARLYQSGATAIVDDLFPNEKVCDQVRIGWGTDHRDIALLVAGGTFRCQNQLRVGLRGAKNCKLQVDSGHVITNSIRSARDRQATASFIINGGIVDVASSMELSELSSSGGAVLIMNGGVLNVDALDTGQGAPVTITLNGGAVNAGSLDLTSAALLEINDGTLIVNGDIRDQVSLWAAQGQITGFGIPAERGSVQANYDSEQDKTTITADASKVDLNKAWNYSPVGENAPLDTLLTWSAGDATAATQGHDVYLGQDLNAVANDTTESTLGTYRGRQDGTTYAIPFELILGQTYYWRIDQINSSTGEIHQGDVLSFTVQPSVLTEGFDTYPLWSEPDWDAHLNVWQQSGGAESYIVDAPAVEGNSLEVTCKPDAGDAALTLPLNADWNRYGIRALNFMFRGDSSLSELKVTLGDGTNSATVSIMDENILHLGAWRAVDIDLGQFVGVDLSQLKQLSLAVAYNEAAWINYDLIRVYPQRCIAEFGPTGDLNGDCMVDAEDLALLTADWLKSGYEVTAAEPVKAALVHHDMDQESGTMVTDAMGLSDGILLVDDGAPSETEQWDPTGGVNGSGCLTFNGHLYMDLDAPTVFATVDKRITVSLWINGDADQQPPLTTQQILHGWMAAGWGVAFRAPTVNGDVQFVAGANGPDNTMWQGSTPVDWEGGWTHYALVKDAGQGIQRIYRNGELVAENTSAFKDVSHMIQFTFGGSSSGGRGDAFQGKLDGIRIYDVALPQAEVLHLAGGVSLNQPVFSTADLNGDDVVDQADRDMLEANMGTEQLWPWP